MTKTNTKLSLKGMALLLMLFLQMGFALGQTQEALFEKGNSQYARGNFQEAVSSYHQVIDSGYESAALYYNLANSYYKLDSVAPSIYYYEKALQLKPNDPEIRNNLRFAQNMTVDEITPLPENIFRKWNNRILNLLSIDGWATLNVVLILLFTVSFLVYYFISGTTKKRVLFTIAFVCLGLGMISLVMAFQSKVKTENTVQAIVFEQEAQVKSGPNLSSEEAFTLHEGTKVRVLEQDEDWKRIRLADGKEGWIPAAFIREL